MYQPARTTRHVQVMELHNTYLEHHRHLGNALLHLLFLALHDLHTCLGEPGEVLSLAIPFN
jgi:hypothetical protein